MKEDLSDSLAFLTDSCTRSDMIQACYSNCIKSFCQCREFISALYYCITSLGQHSLYFYFRGKKLVTLVQSLRDQNEFFRSLNEVEQSPEEALFWLNELSPASEEEERGIVLLKKVLSGWLLYRNKEEFLSVMQALPSDPFLLLESDLKVKRCVYLCLKGSEGCEELCKRFPSLQGHIEPVRSFLKERAVSLRNLIDRVRQSDQWDSCAIAFHRRKKYDELNSQRPSSLSKCLACMNHLHVGFFSKDSDLGVINTHISFKAFEEGKTRDIELLGSDILKVDAVAFVPKKERLKLLKVFQSADENELARKLNKEFEKILAGLIQEARALHLSNSTWTRWKTPLTFPWSVTKIYDRPYCGSMQCVHFVALTIAKAVHRLESDLQRSHSISLLYPFPVHTNPASLLPSQLYAQLTPFCHRVGC